MVTWRKTWGVLGLALSGVVGSVASGCAGDRGQPASAAVVTLSQRQGTEARRIMAQATPAAASPPLRLLPESGVRWADLSRAVGSLHVPSRPDGSSVLVAVVSSTITPERASFELVTSDGWPAVVTAHRHAGEIQIEAVMGPYPADLRAAETARALEDAAMASLRRWGNKPELPAEGVSR